MQVTLTAPNAKDEFHIIHLEEFMKIVDRWDLEQRCSKGIIDAYHEHWLEKTDSEVYLFHPPEFCLTQGVATFINGRHRTLVLTKHLNEIPMALTNMDGYPIFSKKPSEISVKILDNISIRKVCQNEVFDFPDLEIKYLGHDENIGK